MDFDNPLFQGEGDPTASYVPDEDDSLHSPHPEPSPHSDPQSPKRTRHTTDDLDDEYEIMHGAHSKSKFSSLK